MKLRYSKKLMGHTTNLNLGSGVYSMRVGAYKKGNSFDRMMTIVYGGFLLFLMWIIYKLIWIVAESINLGVWK